MCFVSELPSSQPPRSLSGDRGEAWVPPSISLVLAGNGRLLPWLCSRRISSCLTLSCNRVDDDDDEKWPITQSRASRLS